ncbi:MAG: ABC transporter permease [Candidatus Binatia bacterium]
MSPVWPTRRAFAVWWRNLESWKRFAPSFFASALGQPVFYLLAMGYGLGRFVTDIDGVPYSVFLTPAIVAMAAMNSATFETTFGAFTRMTEQHTYTAILATPCTVADIVAGDVLWAATKSALSASAVVLVTLPFGLLHGGGLVLLLPVGFLAGLMFGALGMIATARAPGYDYFNYYFTFAISVMMFLSGVFFPMASLPAGMRALAWLMPLTHAVVLARACAQGVLDLHVAIALAWMALVTVVAYALAERLIRRRLLV